MTARELTQGAETGLMRLFSFAVEQSAPVLSTAAHSEALVQCGGCCSLTTSGVIVLTIFHEVLHGAATRRDSARASAPLQGGCSAPGGARQYAGRARIYGWCSKYRHLQ